MGKNEPKSPSQIFKRLTGRIAGRIAREDDSKEHPDADRRRLRLEDLESRILYSGAPAAEAPAPAPAPEVAQEQPATSEPAPAR